MFCTTSELDKIARVRQLFGLSVPSAIIGLSTTAAIRSRGATSENRQTKREQPTGVDDGGNDACHVASTRRA